MSSSRSAPHGWPGARAVLPPFEGVEWWERPSRPSALVSKGFRMEWVVLIAVIVVLLAIDLLLHRGNHEPTAKRALIESAAWVACGLGFAVVVPRVVRRPGVLRVPERLRHREVAQHRQRVRVGGDLLELRHPRPLPAPGAVLGHLRRAGDACDLHLRRHRAHRAVLVDAPRVRCGAAVLRLQGHAAQGRTRASTGTTARSSCWAGSSRCGPSSPNSTSW